MGDILFTIMLVSYSAGVLAALLGGKSTPGRVFSAFGGVLGAGSGIALGALVIGSGDRFVVTLPNLLSLGSGFLLTLDPLGAFFLILIGLGAIPASIYSVGYTKPYAEQGISLRLLGSMYNLFLLCMSLVAMAGNVLTFLMMWEGMSLTSYFLVITENHEKGALRAGNWYAAMTHAGLVMLLVAFVLLMNGGSGLFADLRSSSASLPGGVRNAVFLLAFLGFGSKAGIVPLHVWLPRAHPAAPSHVSALMSGVMIKLGIYGILRVTLDLLGGGPAWWGGVILGFGVISALLGMLYALMEHDLKRLLAYSSVENIGIILIGIGTGFIFIVMVS